MKKKSATSANKQALYNIIATVILSGVNFLTIPLFTRILGTEQYGRYAVYHSWIMILLCFMGLQTSSCTGVGMYKYRGNYYGFRSSILLFSSILSVAIIVPGILFSNVLASILGYERPVVIVMFLSAFAEYIIGYVTGTMTYEKKAGQRCILSASLSIATVGISLALTKFFAGDELYLSRVYGVFVPYGILAPVLWMCYFLRKPSGLKKEYCKFALFVGTPLVLHSLSQSLLTQSDRIMMQYMNVSDVDIGIYSFFYSFANIVMVALTALNTSWCPFYYDDLSRENFEEIRVKSKNYIKLFTTITCGFLLLSREVTYLFAGKEYWGGLPIIPVLVSAIYFTFMYQFAVNFEMFNKKTTIVAVATGAASLLNIALNAVMIPAWGMYGAAIATSLSYAGLFIVHFVAAGRIKTMQFHAKSRDFLPGLAAVLVVGVLYYVLEDFPVVRWCMGGLLGIRIVLQMWKRKSIF